MKSIDIFIFLHQNLHYGYSLDKHGEGILMSTNNISFHEVIRKQKQKYLTHA